MNYASFLSNTFLIHCIDRYDKGSDSVLSVPTYRKCIYSCVKLKNYMCFIYYIQISCVYL